MRFKVYCINIFFIFSTKAYAVETAVSPTVKSQTMKSDAMSGGYLLQLVLGLIIVVICIVALAWFAKKMNRFQSSTDDSLKIIGGISMGSRERVVLLQVGEEQLLIGVSPGRINTLHVLATPLDTNTNHSAGPLGEKILGEKFSDKLKTMMADAGTASVKKKNKQ